MAYRFKLGENPTKALHRVGGEQLERSLAQLDAAEAQTAIHETRKCIKRLRAMLRLVRSGISRAAWRELDHALRDAARGLSAARDRDVLATAALRLSAEHPDTAELLRTIAHRLHQTNGGSVVKKKTPALRHAATTALKAAREKWLALELKPDDFTVLEAGLERNLEAIADKHHACDEGADDSFHDLRKVVQRHWRQMRLVEEGWPAYFGARADEAKAISELLGVAQDLTLFITWLGDRRNHGLTQDQAETVTGMAHDSRAELRKAARTRCARLIADKPHAHARQARELWSSAKQIDKIEIPAVSKAAAAPASVAKHVPAAATRPPRKRSARHKTTTAGARGKKQSSSSP